MHITQNETERNVLIFDLGGGTFDVTIVKIKSPKFDVKATGGEDFNNNLVEYFISKFKEKHDEDISENKRALNRLRVACEGAKRKLSSTKQAKVQIDALQGGYDFRSNISREEFENLNSNLFKRVLDTVKNTLSESGLKKENIDDDVLVGGLTRIPKIREMLEKYFDKIKLKRTINPDEAGAYGPATYAFSLGSDKDPALKEFALEDVTPLSIGIENKNGRMAFAIPRNTKIPTKACDARVTVEDTQTIMTLEIYEGERTLAKDNHFLGKFTISGIPPAPKGKVITLLEIDSCGILYVKAIEEITGNSSEITIARDKGRPSETEIQQIVKEAEKDKKKDQELKQRSEAMNDLDHFAYSLIEKNDQKLLTRPQRESMMNKLTEIFQWLDMDRKEPLEMSQVQAKKKELEILVE
ncbi:heat shock cognate 71 kDa protein-like [Styela clava]